MHARRAPSRASPAPTNERLTTVGARLACEEASSDHAESGANAAPVHYHLDRGRHHPDGHLHGHRRCRAVAGDDHHRLGRPDAHHPNLGPDRARRRPSLAQVVDGNGEAARSNAAAAPRSNAARDGSSNTRWNIRDRSKRGRNCRLLFAGSSCLRHRVRTHWSTHLGLQSKGFVDTSWRPPGPLNSTNQRRWSATIAWR